jgi:formylglycine-generating enzyme required for sulfatase activity
MKSGYLTALSLSLAWGVASFTLVDAADVPEVHYQSRDENHRSVVQDSVGIDLIRVEPGEYLMGGSEPAEKVIQAFPGADVEAEDFTDEYPRHRVRITRPFFLGKFEVTVGQFRKFVDETGYKTEAEQDGTGGWGYNPDTAKSEGRRPHFNWRSTGYPQTDQYPVVNVTYNDALAFIGWLSTREGKRYRLPTEAEWEYANRAGSESLYSNSDDPREVPSFARAIDVSRQRAFHHVQDLTIRPNDPSAFPAPVGSYAANALGFHDMHGNVWEWVADWYGAKYYSEPPVDDPQGPASGNVRVRRGGGWNSFPFYLRSSFRNINTPGSRCLNLGFRVAREL